MNILEPLFSIRKPQTTFPLRMFILRFFVNAVSSAVESLFCLCIRPSSDSGGGGDDENTALVSEEDDRIRYASDSGSLLEQNGLTSEYHSWFESKTAVTYACANLLAYLLAAVIGFSFIFEKWPIVDSIYFAVVLFTTVGKDLYWKMKFIFYTHTHKISTSISRFWNFFQDMVICPRATIYHVPL